MKISRNRLNKVFRNDILAYDSLKHFMEIKIHNEMGEQEDEKERQSDRSDVR